MNYREKLLLLNQAESGVGHYRSAKPMVTWIQDWWIPQGKMNKKNLPISMIRRQEAIFRYLKRTTEWDKSLLRQ